MPLQRGCHYQHYSPRLIIITMVIPQAGGSTALQWACYKGHTEVADWLLGLGAEVNVKNKAGADPLQLAAKTGKVELVKLLLDAGADISSTDIFQKSALHYAAYLDRPAACDLLISAGAQIDVAGQVMTGCH